jgi:hypothetical protein
VVLHSELRCAANTHALLSSVTLRDLVLPPRNLVWFISSVAEFLAGKKKTN